PNLPVGYWSAQAAENYRTHLQGYLAQVGDLHVHFESAHAAGLVLAHDEFQMIAAGSEHEAGVVLHVLAADLLGALHGQLHRIPQAAHGEFAALEDLANDVDGRVVFIFFGDIGDLRPGDHQRNGEVVVRIVLAEIGRARIEGDV